MNIAKVALFSICSFILAFSSYKIGRSSPKKIKENFRPHLTVMGFTNMADGLGRQSVELISALKDDVSVRFIPTREGDLNDIPADIKEIVQKKNNKLGRVIIFEDVLNSRKRMPYRALKETRADDQIRIAYSMYESTRIPKEWPLILNLYFDAVAVPDKFLVDVYKQCGVEIPVFVLPLGLDLSNFFDCPLKSSCGSPMVFANLGSCFDRKNQIALIRAFALAFGNNSDVSLKINSRMVDKALKQAIEEEIVNLGLDNIQFTTSCLDKKSYLKNFRNVDCYVSPSKGEGFSIQPREAMALGIPVILTNNTAQSTICESNLVCSVLSEVEEPAISVAGTVDGNQFNCDVGDLARALLDVYENYDSYLAKGEQARKWVTQYQYKNLRPYYLTLVKPKDVILGTENKITPDCLVTNSKELFDKYHKLILEDEYTEHDSKIGS